MKDFLHGSSSNLYIVLQVKKLLELFEIEDKLDGLIGDGGLSVEEAKRLTIGVELISHIQFIKFPMFHECGNHVMEFEC